MNGVNSSGADAETTTMQATASVTGDWAAATVAAAPFGRSFDAWIGLSRDLIERFIEVTCLQRSLSRSARRGYRSDLVALDNWMQRTRGRTLIGARSGELRVYLDERIEAGIEARLLRRLLTSLHRFYKHLHETGCRSDNPAARLIPRNASRGCATLLARSAHR